MTALDEKWFSQLKMLNAQVPRRLKVGNYVEAKKAFYASDSDEPAFSFPNLDDSEHERKVSELDRLLEDIESDTDTHEVVKGLYRAKIKEKRNQFTLLELFRSHIESDQVHVEIQSLVEEIYGFPSQSVFNHLIVQLRTMAEEMSPEVSETKSFKRLCATLAVDDVRTDVPDFVSIPAKTIEENIYTNAHKVRLSVLEVLRQIGLNDWRVQISIQKVGGFCVWPNTKRIIIPNSKMLRARKGDRVLTEAKLQATIAHEVLTHALRTENGLKSPLALLSIGLAGYWHGEEGIASYREHKILGATDFANKNMHLAIGLAYGLDRGGVKRTFREVFEVMSDYFYVFGDHNKISAKNKAFASCERIYKLATGQGHSFILTKDIAYREGNIAIHKLLANNPAAEKWFTVGKFDPTNGEHVEALKTLSIIS